MLIHFQVTQEEAASSRIERQRKEISIFQARYHEACVQPDRVHGDPTHQTPDTLHKPGRRLEAAHRYGTCSVPKLLVRSNVRAASLHVVQRQYASKGMLDPGRACTRRVSVHACCLLHTRRKQLGPSGTTTSVQNVLKSLHEGGSSASRVSICDHTPQCTSTSTSTSNKAPHPCPRSRPTSPSTTFTSRNTSPWPRCRLRAPTSASSPLAVRQRYLRTTWSYRS